MSWRRQMGKKIAAEEVQDSDLIEGVCDVLHHRRHRLSPREHHRDVKNNCIKPGVVLRTWLRTLVACLIPRDARACLPLLCRRLPSAEHSEAEKNHGVVDLAA
jgi:hypothetical protein